MLRGPHPPLLLVPPRYCIDRRRPLRIGSMAVLLRMSLACPRPLLAPPAGLCASCLFGSVHLRPLSINVYFRTGGPSRPRPTLPCTLRRISTSSRGTSRPPTWPRSTRSPPRPAPQAGRAARECELTWIQRSTPVCQSPPRWGCGRKRPHSLSNYSLHPPREEAQMLCIRCVLVCGWCGCTLGRVRCTVVKP